ncbi:MAG: type I restriction endonuclease subunit R [Calditrichaceae bacterium]|nr:type I restriction endonuclease subunit R [Calditrichaceae bacterium]MBN2707578.1 type I restriction endonuclease subunit R [Calditrichaceae bacterium]RQV95662.1 MAG: type I restriction endonuclease subunit R [Calditrichota bacterium]
MTYQSTPDLREDPISQVPALHVLQNLGWQYLTPKEALELRGNKYSKVLLEGILVPWLREHNTIYFKGRQVPFSEGNILSAVQALDNIPLEGLILTNEKIFDLLSLGKSLQQSIDGDIKSFTLNYIDWVNPQNNVYHVTEEFGVERTGSHQTRRPDIVLFVNGIPMGVIECKSPDIKDPIGEAVSQHIRNQKEDEIPKLFLYSQILLALSKNEAKYATTGTAAKFWAVWREQTDDFDEKVKHTIDKPLTPEQIERMNYTGQWIVRENTEEYLVDNRQITAQDKALVSLCDPKRFLEITYKFLLFDAGTRKIARYQQYFVVKKIMHRINKQNAEGNRTGGVVWHTQGSGKSLTMVFLAKCIALDSKIPDYKIVLVTDRVDLDEQIYTTFHHCGKELTQAQTGKHLSSLLSGARARIITAIIDKFDAAIGPQSRPNPDQNIFVLVDEGHRGQYGPRHAKMRRALPNACYIAFTGTPVMKQNKNTVDKFGGLIDAYTIDRAVEDKAVVPLLYEGRDVDMYVDKIGIDTWFDRITSNLSRDQANDLKRKFSTTDQVNKAQNRVMAIAWDISNHFYDNWKGTIFKAQIVAQDKATALLYKKYLDEFNQVCSEVLISGPDEREGEENIYLENKKDVILFWKAMMSKYGSEREYNKQLINAFKKAEEPEIIIVVDKLLTGFDAPRNTILYLTRKLKDHTLLQAIARVNRLHDGKDFGYIIDYRGILSNLDQALDLYCKLPEFDREDLLNILTDVQIEVSKLPERYSLLWDTFKEVKNRRDEEEYELLLANAELRNQFYERLSAYARTLSIALSSTHFLERTEPGKIDEYKRDLKFFSKLRLSVRRRYAEEIDFSEYEPKIQKLLDTHIGAGEVETLTPLVNIFDKDAFSNEVDKIVGDAAKADTIAHRTQRTIYDRMEEDPAFYKKFSQLLEAAIQAFREERIKAAEYLQKVTEIMHSVINRTGDDSPEVLTDHDIAKAYYGTINSKLARFKKTITNSGSVLADLAMKIDKIIQSHRIVNWINNVDIQNKMRTDIEDALFDLKSELNIDITFDDMDLIIEECLDIAKRRLS